MAAAIYRTRGTTLAAPAAWAVAAAVCLALVEATIAWSGLPNSAPASSLARYAAAVGTCCPIMAVLGAKRPQDRGWQWVVATLWAVLLVPAGQAWASRGGVFELSGMWRIMLAGLIALGPLNYLPTRHAASALLFAGGQLLFFTERLFAAPLTMPSHRLIGLAMMLSAAMLAARPRRWSAVVDASDESQLLRFTRRWRSFRDGWGAWWGLRILHRVNEAASLSQWPVRLEWRGFVSNIASDAAARPIDEALLAHIEQTFDSLLRRFERVSMQPISHRP
jgi:hypothetical protein